MLEGEGLVNDATALILFSFAIAAVTEGRHFSLVEAGGEFLAIVLGEIAWGLFLGWSALRLRRWASDPRVEMVFALLTPFAAFWIPEALGGSGVLATVTCGLFVSWNGPRFISPATRLQGYFVWDLMVYLVESVVFLLTGLQARVVADSPGPGRMGASGGACAAVCAVIIAVRFIWVYLATYLPRWLSPLAGAQGSLAARAKAPLSLPSPAFVAWCRWRRRCPSRWMRAAGPFPIADWCCWRPLP